MEQYQNDTQTKAPLALDSTGEIFRRFGVRQIPTVALIDNGQLTKIINPADSTDSFFD